MESAGADEFAKALRKQAIDQGFSGIGICAPTAIPEAAGRLQDFIDAGYHGSMVPCGLSSIFH